MVLSAFFSSSETSLFSLNKRQLEQMRRDDNPKVRLIERLLSEPRRLIVTILIGNEFVNVAASVVSAAIVINLLGAENKLFNLFIMVPILLLVGEITPKTMAIRNNAAFATFQSPLLDLFARLISPLRWLVRQVAEWCTTLLVGRELARANIVTRDMVRTLAHEAVGDGVLAYDEAQYIEQIFNFGHKTVEDIMTPRSNIFFLSSDDRIEHVVSELKRTRHTKVPVYREHRDEIVGILYARDLLSEDLDALANQPERLLEILREPYFVPETKPVSDLLHTFRKRRLSVAIAVDEYGGVTGLTCMEDLLECIFGDIPSPSETQDLSNVEVLDDGSAQVDGSLPIAQFNAEFDRHLDDTDFETIGGYILHHFGELPDEGSSIVVDELSVTIKIVEANRIRTMTVKKLEPGPSPDKAPETGDLSTTPEAPPQNQNESKPE